VEKSFNIQELLHCKCKHGTKPHTPLLVKGFPKTSRTGSEASWFDESRNYKGKTNYLPS